MKTRSAGFTLIELAVVIAILGLLLGGTVIAFGKIAEGAKVKETGTRMDYVERALLAYVISNQCLPCPADPAALTGLQDPSASACSGSCNRTAGAVPWVTIGIAQEDAADAWGRYFTYGVPGDLHAASSMVRNASSFPAVTDANELVVRNPTGTTIIGGTTSPADLAYVVLSHGSDGSFGRSFVSGALQADRYGQSGTGVGQDDNGDNNLTFAFGQIVVTSDTSYFDDILRYKSARNMLLDCGSGSCGNP